MRHKGIHIQDGFPCFLTTAHTEADIDAIAAAFEESVRELVEAGFIPSVSSGSVAGLTNNGDSGVFDTPPHPEARLGLDDSGNPAWFIKDSDSPANYLKIEQS